MGPSIADELYLISGKLHAMGGRLFLVASLFGKNSRIYTTKLNNDGSLIGWEYVGDTLNISQPSTIFVGNRLFLIGGTIPNGTLLGSLNPNVYSSMIDETGKKGPWVGERPLPNGFLGAAVCLSRDRLVITGGLHNPCLLYTSRCV